MSASRTLSLKCPCGYIKHDVMHLGIWKNHHDRLLKYCGGLFMVKDSGDAVVCKKCSDIAERIEFNCAFCGRVTIIGVQERVSERAGKTVVMELSIHKTVVFSS